MKMLFAIKASLFCIFTLLHFKTVAQHEHLIVVVTCSYNNQDWYQRNILSVIGQNYSNYLVLYINDCSTDLTAQRVPEFFDELKKLGMDTKRFRIINNNKRVGALANIYTYVHQCPDEAIIVLLDGDDWLGDNDAFNKLNEAYSDTSVWLVHSQCYHWNLGRIGWGRPYTKKYIDNSKDRDYSPAHLRTFYAKLFKKIKREDLMYEGDFFSMTYDMAIMLPMMEMARDGHIAFLPNVLYTYNDSNPISDHQKNKALQRKLDLVIRAKEKYAPLKSLF